MKKNKLLKKNTLVRPVLTWIGDKSPLLDVLKPLLPTRITTYCEPFVGGGAVFFNVQANIAYINDINHELIRVYSVIKDNVEPLITTLSQFKNDADSFYTIRDWGRNIENYFPLSDVEKAARILYLNNSCYHGWFKMNNAGEFNVLFGNYHRQDNINAQTLRAVSTYLNTATIHLSSVDYTKMLDTIPCNAFVYLDPPHDLMANASNFMGYPKSGFTGCDQIKLREYCDKLNARGIKFMLSRALTNLTHDMYSVFNITVVKANSNAKKHGEVDLMLVRNYR